LERIAPFFLNLCYVCPANTNLDVMSRRLFSHLNSAFFLWNLLIMCCVSLAAGFFIVTHGRQEKLFELFELQGIWSSTLYSGLIAFLLLLMVYAVSFLGNARYAGQGRNGRWFVFQLVYGVLLTLVLELVLASLLFWIQGHWILETAFFDKLFLPAVLFVLLANACYLLFFMQQVRHEIQIEVQVKVPVIRYVPVSLVMPEKVEAVAAAEVSEPALFYIHNGEVWKKNFQGERKHWPKSLKKTMAGLDPKLYFKCSRQWIVHRNAVASIHTSDRNIKVRCIFSVRVLLMVPRRNVQAFKLWLYGDEDLPLP